MPIMRPLTLALLFVLGFTHYRPLAPTHNIAAGEVNRNSDLVEGDVWTYSDQGFVYDRSSVVGHKALVPLHGGTRIKRQKWIQSNRHGLRICGTLPIRTTIPISTAVNYHCDLVEYERAD